MTLSMIPLPRKLYLARMYARGTPDISEMRVAKKPAYMDNRMDLSTAESVAVSTSPLKSSVTCIYTI